jgi:hypothetical protein
MSQIPEIPGLVIRCHGCKGTQIYERTENGEIETYHGCFNGKQSREAFAALQTERDALQQENERLKGLLREYREFHYGVWVESSRGRKMCIRGDDRCDLCKRTDEELKKGNPE